MSPPAVYACGKVFQLDSILSPSIQSHLLESVADTPEVSGDRFPQRLLHNVKAAARLIERAGLCPAQLIRVPEGNDLADLKVAEKETS
jgi:hypothetical protein